MLYEPDYYNCEHPDYYEDPRESEYRWDSVNLEYVRKEEEQEDTNEDCCLEDILEELLDNEPR